MPQEGNLEQHFKEYEKAVDELIPDRNYNGLYLSCLLAKTNLSKPF